MLGALGVVYGDIGTSPLYAFKEAVKAATAGGASVPAAATGAVSLILWSLILIVSLKYAVLILRADNRGEGGIVAMLALLGARQARPGSVEGAAAGGRAGRGGAALRRRRDHAGDLGPVGDRGPEGRRAGVWARTWCRSRW
ncbi:KUP/HAK/KT family potassium transporter [Methylobacterium oryzae CBMB20]